MKTLFENIDLFPYRINFNFKKNNVFLSIFGLILSIIMYGNLIFFINYFSKDFINKTNPQIIYKETIFTDKLLLKFDDIFQDIQFNLTNFSNFEKMLNKNNKTIDNKFVLILEINNYNPEFREKTDLILNFKISPDSNKSLIFEYNENTTFNIQKIMIFPNDTQVILQNNTSTNIKDFDIKVNSETTLWFKIRMYDIIIQKDDPIFFDYNYNIISKDSIIDINDIEFFQNSNYLLSDNSLNNKMIKNMLKYEFLEVKNDFGLN